MTARIFNDGTKDETLTSITVKGAGERVKLSPAEGEKTLTVPAGGSLALGGEGNAAAVLPESGSTAVKDGNAQPVTFDLSRTGAVSLRATVVPAHGRLQEVRSDRGAVSERPLRLAFRFALRIVHREPVGGRLGEPLDRRGRRGERRGGRGGAASEAEGHAGH